MDDELRLVIHRLKRQTLESQSPKLEPTLYQIDLNPYLASL